MNPTMPFAGLRVLDAAGPAAPACGMLLSMFGAEVYLLETSEDGRQRDDLEWLSYNAGKQSIVVDWSAPADVELVRSLLRRADVLVDAGQDLGGLVPAYVNPVIVHASVTPFGLTGPAASWRGSELIAEAAGGMLFTSGDPAFPPAISAIPVSACMAGAHAAAAILLSLLQRETTGRGDRIDVSAQEATTSLMVGAITSAYVTRTRRGRAPTTLTAGVPERRYYETGDGGLIAWSLTTGPGWGALNKPIIAWLQEEGGGADLAGVDFERVSSHNLDEAKRRAWLSEFRQFFLQHTKDELVREAVKRRIMLHPVNTIEDVVNDDVLIERNVFTTLTLPDGRQVRAAGRPFRSTAYDVRLPATVPPLGSANVNVEQLWRNTRTAATPRGNAGTTPPKPLTGVRVMDFSWIVAGPVTAKWLALCGADVLKIESRKRPDPNRMTGPFPLGKPFMDGSAQFPNNNANKRSVAIDISHPRARDLLLKLGEKADIVLENFSAGVMDRHRLGYEDFRAVNPGIIMIAMSLQGQTGSRAHQPGVGSHVQMRSGLDAISGFPDAQPGGPAVFLPDLLGPWVGITGLLAALEHRKHTGTGQYIDLSQYEAMLLWMQPALLHRELYGSDPPRKGNASDEACPHGVFPVRGEDRWIAIECRCDEEWRRLRSFLPAGARAAFQAASTLQERLARRPELEAAIADWTKDEEGPKLMVRLQEAGVGAYVVNDSLDLLEDPQMAAREHCSFPEHSIIGRVPVEKPAFRTRNWTFDPITLGPLYASGTADALREWLYLDDDAIADLAADAVITF